jgi:hypothetical protein
MKKSSKIRALLFSGLVVIAACMLVSPFWPRRLGSVGRNKEKTANSIKQRSSAPTKKLPSITVKAVEANVVASVPEMDRSEAAPNGKIPFSLDEDIFDLDFNLTAELIKKLNLDLVEAQRLKSIFVTARMHAAKLARKKATPDPESKNTNADNFIMRPFIEEGRALRMETRNAVMNLLGSERGNFFLDRIGWHSLFANFGEYSTKVSFYSQEFGGKEIIRFNYTEYDGGTGKEISSGTADYKEFLARHGDVFQISDP